MTESIIEFLVNGKWLKPLDPPEALQYIDKWGYGGWESFGVLTFKHPRHGVVKVQPRMCLARLAK